jgi:hypothetical protein
MFFDFLALKMKQIGYPETSVRNSHCTLRNIIEQLRSRLRRGGSPKSPTATQYKDRPIGCVAGGILCSGLYRGWVAFVGVGVSRGYMLQRVGNMGRALER